MYFIKHILLVLISTIGILSFAQTSNLTNLITSSDWEALFPKRAGTSGGHPQGVSTDFYSYDNLSSAVEEMADYSVEIKLKDGVYGQLITITKKSSGTIYLYQDVSDTWKNSAVPEQIIGVDFADFINTASAKNNKRELAAFLANISKETTGGWEFPVGGGSYGDYADLGLYYIHELNCTNATCKYALASTDYQANSSVGYFGRGPIQLSYNVNYGQFSKFIYNDPTILLNNPDALIQDGALAFKSAIWFWMMPQCPKPSCHQVMHDLWVPQAGEFTAQKMYQKGFAHTNNIINGSLECRTSSTSGFTEKVVMRSELYKYYLEIMGFTVSEIAEEDQNGYTTQCYESSNDAMEDYINCEASSIITREIDSNVLLDVSFFPNPTTDEIIVKGLMNTEIRLFDTKGTLIETKWISENGTIDLRNLPSGVYYIESGDAVIQERIVKN